MGSSSDASGNPMFLSRGNSPIPNLPVAGQGAPNDNPRNLGSFQNFLPDIPPAGQGAAPLARGLTAEMLQFRSPQGVAAPGGGGAGAPGAAPAVTAAAAGGTGDTSAQVADMRQQLAQLQAQAGNGQFGAARNAGGYSGGGPAAPGLSPSQVMLGVS